MQKRVLRGSFTTKQAYLKKLEKYQIKNKNVHFKKQKKEQAKLKDIRREEIKGIVEINEIMTKKTIEKINETKSCLLEKISKIDKPSARLTKEKREIPNK